MPMLRKKVAGDVDALFTVWHDAVVATHDFLLPGDLERIGELVREHYLPAADLWVAVDDENRPQAFMGLSLSHVDSLFVAPAAHGRGLGSALIRHAAQLVGALTTDVNEQNGDAVGFYRHMGFVQTGRSPVDSDGRPYPLLHMRRPAA